MEVKNSSYVTIQAFMVNDLKLGGNELIIYAVIYCFSQDGVSWFSGSRAYLAQWCQASKMTVSTNLKKLVDKGLVRKRSRVENNVTFVDYQANLEALAPVKKLDGGSQISLGGSKETLAGGSQKTLPHIIELDKTSENIEENIYMSESTEPGAKKSRSKKFVPPTFEQCKEWYDKKGYTFDLRHFFDYFNDENWIDSKGNKVKDWKRRMVTFQHNKERYDFVSQKQQSVAIIQHTEAEQAIDWGESL